MILLRKLFFGVGFSLYLSASGRSLLPHPEVPDGLQESPYVETAPEVVLTAEDRVRGCFLFSRPLTEPVFAESRPHSFERMAVLKGFASQNELETLNFAIYPVRCLRRISVEMGEMRSGGDVFPRDRIEIGLVTYWNIKYPSYLSFSHYRRMPEYVEPASVFDAAAEEPQRIFLTFRTSPDIPSGLYCGKIRISSPDLAEAVFLPVQLQVLPLRLESAPEKMFSAYHAVVFREPQWRKKHDFAWMRKAADNEYRAMRDCGLNTAPNVYLSYSSKNGKSFLSIPFFREAWELMQKHGLKAPVPVVGCGFHNLYQKHTGCKMLKHIVVSKPVPEALYEELDRMVKDFKEAARQNHYPEMIFCPLDEISPGSMEIGRRVYRIFHENGLKTFTTKDPISDKTSERLAPYVDVWCSQTYSMPYDRAVADRRHEYWCYPNHNAYEFKDPLGMCKGGRMTYGFGNWRSGYRMLMPWVWRSGNSNHLHPSRDAGGNRLEEDGSVTLTTYWIAFREGVDDLRYIYTLQQLLARRRGNAAPEHRRQLREAAELLQELWRKIPAMPKYLRDGMWPSEEFDVWRRRLGDMAVRIAKLPVTDPGAVAPSVMVADASPVGRPEAALDRMYRQGLEQGNLVEMDLGETSFASWSSHIDEVKLRRPGDGHLLFSIQVDHYRDGEGTGGKYKVGWPRIYRTFPAPGLDMTGYDFFLLKMKISSNRSEVDDDATPMYLSVQSHDKFSKDYQILNLAEEECPLTIFHSVGDFLALAPEKAFQKIRTLQLGIQEEKYPHGTRLELDLEKMALVKFSSCMLYKVEAAEQILWPADNYHCRIETLGNNPQGKFSLEMEIRKDGIVKSSETFIAAPRMVPSISVEKLSPGKYQLLLVIRDRRKRIVSHWESEIFLYCPLNLQCLE